MKINFITLSSQPPIYTINTHTTVVGHLHLYNRPFGSFFVLYRFSHCSVFGFIAQLSELLFLSYWLHGQYRFLVGFGLNIWSYSPGLVICGFGLGLGKMILFTRLVTVNLLFQIQLSYETLWLFLPETAL